MIRFTAALLVSLAVHALLAAALAVYFGCIPLPDLPRLDLSAVELSFAEEERETAETPLPPPPPPEPEPPTPEPEPEPEPPPPEPEPESEPPPPEPEPPPPPEPEPPPPEPEPPPPEPEPLPPPPEPEPPPPEPEPPPPPEPEPAPRQARIDAPPRQLKPIRPDYPKEARQRGEEGDVVLELSIDERGRVAAAAVALSSGHPELDAAALRAAKKARFVPAKSGSRPVAADARLTIEFRLK